MIQILDRNLSPISNPLAMGDIYLQTGIPLVLHNPLAEPAVGITGNVLPVAGSDGFERLKFFRAEAPRFSCQPAFYTPDQLAVSGDTIAPGDIFDLHVEIVGWVAGQVYRAGLPVSVMIVSGVISPHGPLAVSTNLPHTVCNVAAYLRRRGDSQWFSTDGAISDVGLTITAITAVADPALDWEEQAMSGYSRQLSTMPLPANAAYIEAGDYEPALGVIEISGGSGSQNVFSMNPRRAEITITGGVIGWD